MIEVFHHLLYDISRGLRDLALYTITPDDQNMIEAELLREGVSYLFRPIDDGRVNVYFGHKACIDVVKTFGGCAHCEHTPEQDFILGIMLGYDRTRQCERFLARRERCAAQKKECPVFRPSLKFPGGEENEHSLVRA